MESPTQGHEFEQIPGDSEGQGSLVCCSPWGRKEWDTTEQLPFPFQYVLQTGYTFIFSPVLYNRFSLVIYNAKDSDAGKD